MYLSNHMKFIRRTKPESRGKHWRALYECSFCGTIHETRMDNVTGGHTKSCGCQKSNVPKHGHNRRGQQSLTYTSWYSMKTRCLNSKATSYKNYGGKGIKVCKHWLGFENFLNDMGERPSKKHCLSRIDHDQDYGPGNVKWILRSENSRESMIRRWNKYGVETQ